jgi:hypothetical protein
VKRNQHRTSNKPRGQTRQIEPRRLTEARGGGDLGITVARGIVIDGIMQMQHNEALIRLWRGSADVESPR